MDTVLVYIYYKCLVSLTSVIKTDDMLGAPKMLRDTIDKLLGLFSFQIKTIRILRYWNVKSVFHHISQENYISETGVKVDWSEFEHEFY